MNSTAGVVMDFRLIVSPNRIDPMLRIFINAQRSRYTSTGAFALVVVLTLFATIPAVGQSPYSGKIELVSLEDASSRSRRESLVENRAFPTENSGSQEIGTLEHPALNRTISIDLEKVSLEYALKEIARKGGLGLAYLRETISVGDEVTLERENVTVLEALRELLRTTSLTAMLSPSGQLIVTDRPEVMPNSDVLKPQEHLELLVGTITGTVTDSTTGERLPGVSIVIEGTQQGTITDADGNFTIPEVEAGIYNLRASFIGYSAMVVEGVEVSDNQTTTINIALQPSVVGLDEVVVVGYGTQRREEITGAVSSIDGEELNQVPTANITNNLGGRIPGLIAVNSDGSPGSGSSISVRGASTFGDNSALIVVDGIVRESFEYIDPNSIESVTVLKDASATAVYGSRAANGVVLVTTKRGHVGDPVFSYNMSTGVQQPTTYPRLLNAYEFARTRNQALANEGEPIQYSEEMLEEIGAGRIIGTDWYGESLKKQSLQMQHNLNVRGGSDAIKYFLSAGYVHQDGMYDRINFHSYYARSNVDATVNNNLTISADFDLSRRNRNGSGYSAGEIFSDIIGANPLDHAYNPDGTIAYTNEMHPIEQINTGYNRETVDVAHTTLSIEQKVPFVEGLSAVGTVSLGRESGTGKLYRMPIRMNRQDESGNTLEIYSTGGYNGKTALNQDSYSYNAATLIARMNYSRTFGEHDVDAFGLFEQFDARWRDMYGFRTNFPADGLDEMFFGGEQEKDASGGSFSDGRRSFVGRINYGYKNRYLLQASLRADGSVAFPQSKKYGFFPAVSIGWRVSEEPFMSNNANLDFIDYLKIRASYGVIGNDRNVYVGREPTFQFLQVYTPTGTLVSGGTGLSSVGPGVLPNPSVTWETASNYDLGMDGSLWQSKLEFEVGGFYKRTSNILLTRIRSVPETFGAQLPAENYAVVDNRGVELSLSHNNDVGRLNYFLSLNGSYTQNKVITLDEPANLPESLRQTGRPLGFIVGYKAIGFFQSDAEVVEYLPQFGGGQKAGDVKYADINGDGVVDVNDRTIISMNNNIPKFIGGLTLGGAYRGLDFNVLVQGAAKVSRLLTGEARTFFLNGSRNTYVNLLDYWTPDNPDALYPRPTEGADVNNTRDSNLYLRDGKYLRLKSVNLGYTLPASVLESIGGERMRIYISATNLFHLDSKLNMFDPEMPSGRGAYYPQQRSFNIGLNLTF